LPKTNSMYPETFFKVNRLSSSQFLFVSFLNLMIYLFCCARKVLIDWLVYINFKNEIPWYDIWSEGSLSIFWYCPWLCYYFKGIKTLLVHKRTKSTYPFGKCKVCNDKATGIHYGIATCEGCKVISFFFS
jgi:hypothetical protein